MLIQFPDRIRYRNQLITAENGKDLNAMTEYRIVSLLAGYLFGMFLTAEIVARKTTGKSASEIGATGNPGMANIMAHLGFKAGILTLAGDLGKCILACALAAFLFRDHAHTAVLYAGLGCTLGHDFPAWKKFRGGKGVASGCAAKVLYAPLWGSISVIGGMLVVFASQYLCFGGIAIPACFAILMAVTHNTEAACVGIVYLLLSLWTNRKSLRGIRTGETGKDDVLGALRRKFSRAE